MPCVMRLSIPSTTKTCISHPWLRKPPNRPHLLRNLHHFTFAARVKACISGRIVTARNSGRTWLSHHGSSACSLWSHSCSLSAGSSCAWFTTCTFALATRLSFGFALHRATRFTLLHFLHFCLTAGCIAVKPRIASSSGIAFIFACVVLVSLGDLVGRK